MARLTGKDLYVEFGGQDISGDFRTLEVSQEEDLEDVTAGSDAAHQYAAVRVDGRASFTGLYDDTNGETVWDAVAPGTSGILTWGAAGTAAGKPKSSVSAIVASRSMSIPYDGAIEISVEFQYNGAVSESTW